ncbi:MAG: alpha/beta fold hydrolase [Devosia sp.]|uniref:alpha/beta fold hydrolase n=1 Tax=Devosia sp. TaxID=1871048 RepID=UPI0024C746DE|nr:alpha/beta fold hydrolase [Devosia sp.]UYN98950.1 MAG: alpha/beta fold hydrolase [Devosia sp.]
MTGLHTCWLRASGRPRGTLIALPGLAESSEAMLPTLRHWSGRGFDVLGIDPRGHATSPRWTPDLLSRHAGDVIVEDILATLDDVLVARSAPLVLFGHSAGGAAAAAVAARLVTRVDAVLLEDPFWRLPVTQFQDQPVAAGAEAGLRRMRDMKPADRIKEIQALFPLWPEDELQAWAKTRDDTDLSLVADGHVIPSRGWTTLVADLTRAGVPVLVVTGTIRTGMTANHRAILRALGADVHVVRGATHFIRRDARPLFHAIADAFFDRHVPADPASPGAVSMTAASEMPKSPAASPVTPRALLPPGGYSWPK